MNQKNYLKYLQYFSLITVTSEKIPNHKWKEQQTKRLSPEEFQRHLENPTTDNVGIVTGFEDLEVLDIDLKVFSTTSEKNNFWNEYLSILKDAIFDFDKKFVIYKTKNAGYHILYKTKRVGGNQKIAKLKDHKEAVIETRGLGGYVFMYPENIISELSYFEIQYISDADWNILMKISKSFNYLEPKQDIEPKIKKVYAGGGLTPWEDFNNQTGIWSVISDDFTVVRDFADKTFIKRIGSLNYHSGIIYKRENLLWLFSTGTIYPHEKQISPYVAFTYKYHNGDFSASAKDLYNQGFGDRLKKELEEKEKKVPDNSDLIDHYLFNKSDLNFPLEVFPKPFQSYLMECHEKLDSIIDYMGCSLLWTISILTGNLFSIKVKNGWHETPVVWFSLVGRAGVGKTPSIRRILYPLIKENNKEIKNYIKNTELYREYEKLSKKDKEQQIEINKPNKKQFIADDITLEALVDLHQEVTTGVGVFKDELAGWLKDMNKYREGSDLEFWLSTWSGTSVNVNRLTRVGSFVENPFIPVIGGIQPAVLNELYNQEKKDNGFMDRMLISYPDVTIPKYNDEEISTDAIIWYNSIIANLRKVIQKLKQETEEDEIKKIEVYFNSEAKKLWINKFNEITEKQNSDNENEYFKSMYPKQKSYIPRFAFLLNALNSVCNDDIDFKIIEADAMKGAIKLSDYFVATAKKIKFEKSENDKIEKLTKKANTIKEKVYELWRVDNNFNRSKVAETLNVSRQSILNYIKIFENEQEKKDRKK
ncbi:MAG TPA: DUF3987 domain-containing protein [Chitinophagales bacterium]|nr:DUF3987 domain-containing protein [Chitinophagales bacterium]